MQQHWKNREKGRNLDKEINNHAIDNDTSCKLKNDFTPYKLQTDNKLWKWIIDHIMNFGQDNLKRVRLLRTVCTSGCIGYTI